MTQLQAILNYQEVDRELYALEREIAGSSERKEYVKWKKFLEGAPEKLDGMESKANGLKAEAAAIVEKYEKAEEILKDFDSLDELVDGGADISFYKKKAQSVFEQLKKLKFELNEDGLSYTLVDVGTAISKSEVVIDGHDGLPVTKIGYSAFDNSVRKNTKLTKVTIGDYVEVIDCYAFSHCSKLTAVVMGDGVKEIRLGAFRYCSALTSIKLGNSVERV